MSVNGRMKTLESCGIDPLPPSDHQVLANSAIVSELWVEKCRLRDHLLGKGLTSYLGSNPSLAEQRWVALPKVKRIERCRGFYNTCTRRQTSWSLPPGQSIFTA